MRALLALAVCGLLLSGGYAAPAKGGPKCKSATGKDVEWWVMYKLPKMKATAENSFTPDGTEMAYVDSTMKKNKAWTLLKASVYDVKNNPVASTLGPLFTGSEPEDMLYAVYNDQPPEPYNGTAKGHAKGTIMFTDQGGVWLVHSVPRFPFNVNSDTYNYPDSGRENGQIFMCTSLPASALPDVAAALINQFPYIYESGAPDSLVQDESVKLLMDKKFPRKPTHSVLIKDFKGTGGTLFKSYAKHQSADDEIYGNIIAPDLEIDLLVETWRNGAGGKIGPTCPLKGYTVTNMANVVINFQDGQVIQFNTKEDHAKWAVSDNPKEPWFCAGSLNRMLSQYKRGGQTTCVRNEVLHKLFTDAVDRCDRCEGDRGETRYCKRGENL